MPCRELPPCATGSPVAELLTAAQQNRARSRLVQSVVGWAFDRFAEEVERYERMLETFMDDALLAVFGVPRGVQSSSCSTLVRRHRAGERLEAEGLEDSNGTGVPRVRDG